MSVQVVYAGYARWGDHRRQRCAVCGDRTFYMVRIEGGHDDGHELLVCQEKASCHESLKANSSAY